MPVAKHAVLLERVSIRLTGAHPWFCRKAKGWLCGEEVTPSPELPKLRR